MRKGFPWSSDGMLRMSLFEDYRSRTCYYPVPFCIPHLDFLGIDDKKLKRFEKWHKRPQSSHRLFWKLHSEQRWWKR